MRGKGGVADLRGLSQRVQLYTGAPINYGDLRIQEGSTEEKVKCINVPVIQTYCTYHSQGMFNLGNWCSLCQFLQDFLEGKLFISRTHPITLAVSGIDIAKGKSDPVYKPQSTYIYRVQSSVWRLPNHWPPTPSPPSECVLPPHQRRGGYTLAGRRGGGGVNISEDARHWIGLLQYNPSTVQIVRIRVLPRGSTP